MPYPLSVVCEKSESDPFLQGRTRCECDGAPGRTRTYNLRIRSPLLYPLSHGRSLSVQIVPQAVFSAQKPGAFRGTGENRRQMPFRNQMARPGFARRMQLVPDDVAPSRIRTSGQACRRARVGNPWPLPTIRSPAPPDALRNSGGAVPASRSCPWHCGALRRRCTCGASCSAGARCRSRSSPARCIRGRA